MRRALNLSAWLLPAFLALAAVTARAQMVSISGLYTTGVKNSGALLGANKADSHYVVTSSSAGSSYTGNSYTVKTPAPGWLPNTGGAQWIVAPLSGTNGKDPSRPAGTYDYTLTFTMPAGAQLDTVAIAGTGAVDDTAAIYVNGLLVTGQTINSWGAANSFTLNSTNAAFLSGTNTITFRVNNAGTGSTGLMVTGFSGTVIVPEVGAFLPVAAAVGLGAFGVLSRRRRRLRSARGPRRAVSPR